MGKVQQESIDFLEIPHGAPIPGKTIKRVVQEVDIDAVPIQGGIVVKAKAFSWDPYMRPRLRDPKIQSYSPAFKLNEPLTAFGCGEVVRSESDDYPVGSLLVGIMPMQTYPVIPGAFLPYLGLTVAKNEAGLPASTLIGGAGMPGQFTKLRILQSELTSTVELQVRPHTGRSTLFPTSRRARLFLVSKCVRVLLKTCSLTLMLS